MTDARPGAPEPAAAPDGLRASTTGAHPGLVPARRTSTGLVVAAAIGIPLAALAAIVAAGYLLLSLGVATFVAAILALIPLTVVLLGIRWADRWEPEPLPARIFCLLWGAGVSVVVALLVGRQIDAIIAQLGGDPGSTGVQFFGAVIQAPLVEEGAKGFGVLLVFLVARRLFDGPVDGIVYAATVGAGFAFTENILYFGSSLVESGGVGEVALTFVLRGILSPFAHVMFTSMTGLAIGIASTRSGRAAGVLAYVIGLIPAMLLHGLWNAAGFFTGDLFSYLVFYAVVQVPLFAGLVAIVIYLRRQEARLTGSRLAEYAAAGWFNPSEVASLSTFSGRRQARAWAAGYGRSAAMKRYIRDATALASARQRIVADRGRAQAQVEETRLLVAITEDRRALLV